uniref:Uncharacterized protein n=1 Tax=Anguilla anguilla TaxID=7936 RepID=A0A0E9VKX5_ANGAN
MYVCNFLALGYWDISYLSIILLCFAFFWQIVKTSMWKHSLNPRTKVKGQSRKYLL